MALGAVGPLVRRDADVDGRRVVATVGQRGDLVPRRRPQLDETGRRVEPFLEQAEEERIPRPRFDVEAHAVPLRLSRPAR
jgi:hypothetical protein